MSPARLAFGGVGVILGPRCRSLEIIHLGMAFALKPLVPHWADTASICTKNVPSADGMCPDATASAALCDEATLDRKQSEVLDGGSDRSDGKEEVKPVLE